MDLASPEAARRTPVASVAVVTPMNDEEADEESWYVFYSERQQREYYYNPDSDRSTWVLPAGGRRLTDSRMIIETNPRFTPIASMNRFSFDVFDDTDEHDEDACSIDGPWKEKSVLKANLIVYGFFLVGMILTMAYYALNVGSVLASAARVLDAVEENVARQNLLQVQSNLQKRPSKEGHSALYYPSWLNVLNDPTELNFWNEDTVTVAPGHRVAFSKKDSDDMRPALYYPSWLNVLENSREPPRDLELDQLVHNLVSSLETAEVLLNKLVLDAQQVGMELRAVSAPVQED
ncbi:hypothetical protein FisN_13Lh376 [Fistulifera solaris]|uniref:WW domain-containing protein n=1 Tax=Fistulifera solaris TaxID=1519565 RepID=A0A1Z5KLT3_FISSO|nr:hypothetical protein FisN_13Lh376 [Fistulifera solaris]|eukprot:GAX27085.1 hypothetical protein FisN_13Lh376 [Fistulifera solaris]